MKVQRTSTSRKSRTAPRRNPELMEELVTEILLLLPVKSLRRFESVCKAWRSIISDPIFIRAHLRRSASNWEQSPRFVINPHTLEEAIPDEECWPRTFSSHLRFYQWQLPQQCNPRTGKYKVVQALYWSVDYETNMWTDMGMEVFTIAGSGDGRVWREIRRDPPYPVEKFQTAVTVNGFMFWRIAKHHPERLRAILHLSLAEEEFGVTRLPDSLNPSLDAFVLDMLYGRDLCLTACTSETTLTIWTLPVLKKGLNSPWERRYSIEFESSMPCHTMCLPPFSNGVILWRADTVYCYDPATSELTTLLCEFHRMRYQGARKWKNLFTFNFNPFTESLVRMTSS
ncbi:unnamed protein product [Urochloa decumbens]|uniref:F-box domain-containing protein n=1 Tax=Urochloa decumbens TaxID=240449 RepID=A0ABC8ZZN6_9POAL